MVLTRGSYCQLGLKAEIRVAENYKDGGSQAKIIDFVSVNKTLT